MPSVKRLRFPTQDEIHNGTAQWPKSGRYTVYERRYLTTGRIYLIGEPSNNTAAAGQTLPRANMRAARVRAVGSQSYEQMREFFEQHSPYNVIRVPALGTDAGWRQWWGQQMHTWNAQELIVIYYNGDAGHNGRAYSWYKPDLPTCINAFDFIQQACGMPSRNILFLLECFVPTRFHDKADLQNLLKATQSNVEVVSVGQRGQQRDGTMIPGTFTQDVIDEFVELIFGDNDISKRTLMAYSIGMLLAKNKELDGNPYRLDLNPITSHKSRDDAQTIKRIFLDPHEIRHAQTLIFCLDTIKNPSMEATLHHNGTRYRRDEGYGGGDDDDGSDDDGGGDGDGCVNRTGTHSIFA